MAFSRKNYKLYNACKDGNYEEVEARLQKEDKISKSKLLKEYFHDNFSQNTLLHIAVMNGHSRIVKLLLDHGACVNLTTGAGKYTPLHVAASAGQTKCVEILLECQDIVVNPEDEFRKTPYSTATALKGSKYEMIAKLIKSEGKGEKYFRLVTLRSSWKTTFCKIKKKRTRPSSPRILCTVGLRRISVL